jgi:hypothetical protein
MVQHEGFDKLNNFDDLVGTVTRYLPTCTIQPQPFTLPHAPKANTYLYYANCDSKRTKQNPDAVQELLHSLDASFLENLCRIGQSFADALGIYTASLRYLLSTPVCGFINTAALELFT